jgi:hypothetical protein
MTALASWVTSLLSESRAVYELTAAPRCLSGASFVRPLPAPPTPRRGDAAVNEHPSAKGIKIGTGTIMDTTIIALP